MESLPPKSGVGYENMDDVKWDSIVIETNEYLETDAIDGALKQEGNDLVDADLGLIPFVWDIQNQESSKDIDVVFAKCQQLNVNPLDFLTKVETSERKLPNGNSFYVTKSSLDLSNKVNRDDADEEHFVSFQSWIQGYNQFVIGKHHELAHTNESVDKELVESFIDITSEGKVQ